MFLLEVDSVGLADAAESSGVDVAVRQTALTTVLLVRARHTAHSLGTLGHTPGDGNSDSSLTLTRERGGGGGRGRGMERVT